MQLKTLPIEQLKPAPYNPRVDLQPGMPAYERLARSLQEFALVQPLVWNETTGHVVGGHQRLAILKAAGETHVPVVVVNLDLEREKALNITLNNEQVGGRWDLDKLQDLLKDLIELPDFDETLTGFSEEDLNALLFTPDPAFTPDEEEKVSCVTVTMKIDPDDWGAVQPHLDQLLRQFEFQIHIQHPT